MNETEPWKRARYNWKLLSLYKQIQSDQLSTNDVNKRVESFPLNPLLMNIFTTCFTMDLLQKTL